MWGQVVHKHIWGELTHQHDSWVVHHQVFPTGEPATTVAQRPGHGRRERWVQNHAGHGRRPPSSAAEGDAAPLRLGNCDDSSWFIVIYHGSSTWSITMIHHDDTDAEIVTVLLMNSDAPEFRACRDRIGQGLVGRCRAVPSQNGGRSNMQMPKDELPGSSLLRSHATTAVIACHCNCHCWVFVVGTSSLFDSGWKLPKTVLLLET